MLSRGLDNMERKTTTGNIVVNLPKTQRNMYNLRYLANVVIKIEVYRSDPHKRRCSDTLATPAK